MADNGKALVLGGGGVTGVAWEIGLVYGLAVAGVDLTTADCVIGTSAGASAGARITSGISLEQLDAMQLEESHEIAARLGGVKLLRYILALILPGSLQQARARLGHAALRARTVTEAERRAVIADRLPNHAWPEQKLLITAVDAESGQDVIFDKTSGVELVDAVAASCAVPLVWPPVTINGHRYVDGGVRSTANVDLAAGYGRVVVIAPLTRGARPADSPAAQVAALGPHVKSVIVSPDTASLAAIGNNVLDPARRAASAQAGRARAAAVVAQVRAVWE